MLPEFASQAMGNLMFQDFFCSLKIFERFIAREIVDQDFMEKAAMGFLCLNVWLVFFQGFVHRVNSWQKTSIALK